MNPICWLMFVNHLGAARYSDGSLIRRIVIPTVRYSGVRFSENEIGFVNYFILIRK